MISRLLFWLSLGCVSYAYLGYPLVLYIFGRRKSILKQFALPTVSIVIAARNEAARLPAKLANLQSLRYPLHLLQIIVVSDGSTDETAGVLRQYTASLPPVIPILLSESRGKAAALNEAVRHATGEILVFLDARQQVDAGSVSALTCCFADAQVGAVSGELMLEQANDGTPGEALGLYWRLEKAVRRLESASGSVVGVTGAIYALRRELYTPMPPGTILDDVFIPMHVVRAGRRVIFEPLAIARDFIFSEPGKEFARKVRTLAGNYQLVALAPWLLSAANPLLFRFISHKLLRLVVPLLLVVILVSAAVARTPLYLLFFWLQALFYAAATVGLFLPAAKRLKPIAVASTFVMLNAAAALAFISFLKRRDVWR